MAQISKYPISKDVYERVFDVFLKTIVDLQTKKQVSDFFQEFLTPTERIMLAKRLAIGILLAKEYEYREICKILRVSTATIGTVALSYKYGKNYKKVISKLLQDEKIEDFFLKAGESIANLLSKTGSKGGGWYYLKNELKGKRMQKSF